MHLFKKNILNPHKYFDSNCIICNSKSLINKNNMKFTTEICSNCSQLGFINKMSYPVRTRNKQIIDLKSITGISLNKKLIHTFYLGKEVPKQIQLYFLSNLKQLNGEGIFWVDQEKKKNIDKKLRILSSNNFSPIKFTVKSIHELLNDFRDNSNCSYLSKKGPSGIFMGLA